MVSSLLNSPKQLALRGYRSLKYRGGRFLEKHNPRRLEILLYHFTTSQENFFTQSGHNVTPKVFKQQLEYLKKKYHIVSLQEAIQCLSGQQKAAGKPYLHVCFDDGYLCNLTEAYPVLEALKVPATVFVCPSVVNNQDLLWRDKIRYLIGHGLEEEFIAFLKNTSHAEQYDFSLLEQKRFYAWSKDPKAIVDMTIQQDLKDYFQEKGISTAEIARQFKLFISEEQLKQSYEFLDFQNHSWSHPMMDMVDYRRQDEEISKTHDYLQQQQQHPFALAMPFSPYDENTLEVCKKLNYSAVLTVFDQFNPVPSRTKFPFVLHRKMAPSTLKKLQSIL